MQAKNIGDYHPYTNTEETVAFFVFEKQLVGITEHSVFVKEKNVFVKEFRTDDKILSATTFKDKILFGTENGLFVYSLPTKETSQIEDGYFQGNRINAVGTDKSGKLWISTPEAIYSSVDCRNFFLEKETKDVIKITVLNNGNVWFLSPEITYKRKNQKWLPYNVNEYFPSKPESIFVDEKENLWLSSPTITKVYESVRTASGYDALIFKNQFKADDKEIFAYTHVPEHGYIFITSRGIFYNARPTANVLHGFNDKDIAYNIDELMPVGISNQLNRVAGYKHANMIFMSDDMKKIWLINSCGALAVSIKDIVKLL